MLTEDLIHQLAPKAHDDYVAALVGGEADFNAYQFTTPQRLAAFMASVCEETGGLTIVRESGNYTAARLIEVWPSHFNAKTAPAYEHNAEKLFNYIYGPSTSVGKSLGNTSATDGYAYRGGGFLQTTGRDNYTRIGKTIGVDLGGNPALIEDPKVSLKAALEEISKLATFCDRGASGFKAVCNGINRGNALSTLDPIGWVERQQWYTRWSAALGLTQAGDDVLNYGDQGALVVALQMRLAALGYNPGKADGVFGSTTRSAVLTFQAENNLSTDGNVGPATRAALNADTATKMPISDDRKAATMQDLRDAGSTTVALGDKIKAAAGGVLVLSGVTGGAQTAAPVAAPAAPVDFIAATKDTVTEIHGWRSITDLIGETFTWASGKWWVLGIVLAFCLYRWGNTIQWTRLLAHRNGVNVSK